MKVGLLCNWPYKKGIIKVKFLLNISKFLNLVVKFLINHEEIEINKLTQKGTALHLACSLNKPHIVSLLLSKNADPRIMNNEGYIPSDICANEDIIKIINRDSKIYQTQISNDSSKKDNDEVKD